MILREEREKRKIVNNNHFVFVREQRKDQGWNTPQKGQVEISIKVKLWEEKSKSLQKKRNYLNSEIEEIK